jgi:hypothetical protein
VTQLFSRAADLWLRLALLGGAGSIGVGALVGWAYYNHSSDYTQRDRFFDQPVPFSHAHHVGGLRIDCRYCHESVERSSSAGMPATGVCMNCHEKLWTEAPVLAPVRESWRTGARLRWRRVYDLPDYTYFDHSIHVQKGVGCTTCHGRIDRMPITRRAVTLSMQWCLDCHRHPERHLRPKDEVFDPAWEPPADQEAQGRRLLAAYHIDTSKLTHCTVCHR